jgi:hypothetical protein
MTNEEVLQLWDWCGDLQLLTVNNSLLQNVKQSLGLGRILWIGMRYGPWIVRGSRLGNNGYKRTTKI